MTETDQPEELRDFLDDATKAFTAATSSTERAAAIRILLEGWYARRPDGHEGIAHQLVALVYAAEARSRVTELESCEHLGDVPYAELDWQAAPIEPRTISPDVLAHQLAALEKRLRRLAQRFDEHVTFAHAPDQAEG
ncbi:hypothetical protein [Micromonospora sp. WMMD1082]|uniref:hypothetical protein n=1 Tax=Micromonospora sp. WMMD1082 TaxID=3016104 RepID=UPI0024165B84|nr:hypothetical protein [Micromonospora sp. WMMD1082]MDG4796189.1 hypothetical protein [Micromonospora sp. WMMD1082]